MYSKELWLVQENNATVLLDSNSFLWKENLQQKQNWMTKSTNLKENARKIKSVFVIRVALWAEKLRSCLEYCRKWKRRLWKIASAVSTEGHLIGVLNEGSVSDNGNLCHLCLWSSNLFHKVLETPYRCKWIQWAVSYMHFAHCQYPAILTSRLLNNPNNE